MMQFGFNNNCRLGFTFRVMQKTNLVTESSKFAILLQFCFYLQHKLSLLRSRLIGPGSVGSAGQYWVTPAQVATKKKKHKPDLQQTKDTGFQRPVTHISSEQHTSTVVYSTLICGQCTPFLSGHQLGPTILLLTFSLLPRQSSPILQYYSL